MLFIVIQLGLYILLFTLFILSILIFEILEVE